MNVHIQRFRLQGSPTTLLFLARLRFTKAVIVTAVTGRGFVALLGLGFFERFPGPNGLDDVHLAAL